MVSYKKWLALGLTAAVVVALAGCAAPADNTGDSGDSSGALTGEPYQVFALWSQTGALAAVSQAGIEGMTAAVDNINENGGINGRPVEVTIADDKGDPSIALTLLQQQIDSDPPDFVWGGTTSNVSLAVVPLLSRNGILGGAGTQSGKLNDPAAYPYWFSMTSSNDIEAPSAAAKLAADGAKKVAILATNDANGQSVTANYTGALNAENIEVVAESFGPTDLDMTAQLQRLQAEDPDVLLLQGYGPAVGYMLKSRTALGWDVRTVATSSVGNGNNLANISSSEDWDNLQLLVYPYNTPERDNADTPAFKYLLSSLQAQNSKFDQTMQLYTQPWDLLHLVQLAAAQAKSEDGEAVAAALEDLDQPEAPLPYLLFDVEKYSPESHFPILDPDKTFVYVNAGPLVDGGVESVK